MRKLTNDSGPMRKTHKRFWPYEKNSQEHLDIQALKNSQIIWICHDKIVKKSKKNPDC